MQFSLSDIYDKNINFLIGSGASHGLFPTLALGVKDGSGKKQTIETLATHFEPTHESTPLYTLLFMHYYKTCIEPVLSMDFESALLVGCGSSSGDIALENYKRFLETLLNILQLRNKYNRRCNVFTTNYDGCFAHIADQLLENGDTDFVINDGARGFNSRYLQAKNFNSFLCQTGVFERHQSDIPQINLIHIHGSAYWYKNAEKILVDYSKERNLKRILNNQMFTELDEFSTILLNENKTIEEIPTIALSTENKKSFWDSYKSLPIVNPTKWKFHETVFEEHYYQMLRLLSYELEKPNSVFITFGFSFADEHILNLVKRSLSNPTLQLFISCFNSDELKTMQQHFKRFKNVQYLALEKNLNFTAFNEKVFTTTPNSEIVTATSENADGN